MSDTDQIHRVVQALASAADRKDWTTLRSLFADDVDYDYTSVAGGTPSNVPANAIVTGWQQGLSRFASTKHNFSDLLIDIDQTKATVAFTGQATHERANGDRWTCGGDYLYVLSKSGGGWKVTGAKFVMRWEQGARLGSHLDSSTEQRKSNMEKVKFKADGCDIVGDLYKPAGATKSPAVAIVGPMTFQKAQAPTEYAKRFAALGFVAIAFDPRYRGESGGEPRAWENPYHKVEDLKAAVGYLQERPDVASDQVSIFAICQGSSIAVGAAAKISGLRALATVSGHYRDLQGDLHWLTQAGLDARRAQGEAAKERYLKTGVVDYVSAVDKSDMNVGMPGEFVWAWYQPWADRGLWENKYAVMSDADLLAYESITAAGKISVPWLMVHGENCFLPKAALRHMEAAPVTTNTKLIWDPTPHFAYYDHAPSIDRAAREAADWFETAEHVAPMPRFAL